MVQPILLHSCTFLMKKAFYWYLLEQGFGLTESRGVGKARQTTFPAKWSKYTDMISSYIYISYIYITSTWSTADV